MASLAQSTPADVPTTPIEMMPILDAVARRAVHLLTQDPPPDLDAELESCAQEFTWAIDQGPPAAVSASGKEMLALVLATMLANQ